MKRMRISIAMGPYFPVPALLGGAIERVWLGLAETFAAYDHAVTMISRRYGNLSESECRNRVRHIRVPSRDAPPCCS